MEKTMKKYRILSALLVLLALSSLLGLPAWASQTETTEPQETQVPWLDDPAGYRENNLPNTPEYSAGCDTALLLEMNSGIVVYAKNAETRVYPASLTKIMTGMLAVQYAGRDLDKVVTVTEEDIAGIEEAGGELKLKVGEQLPFRDVLYYLMVASSNEAANVVARHVAGSIEDFVNLMNKTAQELGCVNTHYVNAHGLHDPNHYTTARDLSVITRKALTYELFRDLCATDVYTVPATNLSAPTKISSTNYLIVNDGNRYMADDGSLQPYYSSIASGIKTGYTSAAGRCVISRATDGHMDLLVVILGADTPIVSDGSTRFNNFVEAKKLFLYGFDNFEYAQVISIHNSKHCMYSVPVKYSKDKNGVVLVPSSIVNCLLPKGFDKDLITFDYTLDDPNGLTAPLEAHQKVGTVRAYYNGTLIGETSLETITSVSTDQSEKVVDKLITNPTLRKVVTILLIIIAVLVVLLIVRSVLYNVLRRVNRRRAKEARAQRERNDRL
jgi:D-alanyl-D-alanine carboxypeptidase (penicillin-binding protein 5/6)